MHSALNEYPTRRTATARQAGPRLRRRLALSPAWALFLLFSGLYLLTSGGHTYSYDEETMFGLTQSMVERGSLVVPTCPGCAVLRSIPMPEGRNYSRYGPVQSLIAIPPYLVGRALAADDGVATWVGTRYFATLSNAFITAAIAALLYQLARQIGFGAGPALGTALLYGLGTQAWPRAKTFFADPLTTLLILLAVSCWWHLDQAAPSAQQRALAWRWAAGLGLACGVGVGVKFGAGIVIPIFGLAACLSLWRRWRRGDLALPAVLRLALAALVALGVPLVLVGYYNWIRFGSVLETGYGGREVGAVQQGYWQEALPGLLISPGKGIILFSPVVLLGLCSWWLFFRRQPRLALLLVVLCVEHVAFYSRVPEWAGGICWGPRYLDFIVPLLVLPTAAGFVWWQQQQRLRRALVGIAAGAVIALALVVQLLGVAVNFDTGYNSVTTGRRNWTPGISPPLLHARILSQRVEAWWAVRFPSTEGVIPIRGFDLPTETTPFWPRYLPADLVLRVHMAGNTAVTGTLLFDDARAERTPPAHFVITCGGRALATTPPRPVPEQGAATFAVDFVIREAGNTTADCTLTLHNDRFALTGPAFTRGIVVARGGEPLPLVRPPLLLPFPDGDTERWAWFFTDRNQHLLDSWLWYLAILPLPRSFTNLLSWGVGGGAVVCLLVGGVGLLAAMRPGRHPSRRA